MSFRSVRPAPAAHRAIRRAAYPATRQRRSPARPAAQRRRPVAAGDHGAGQGRQAAGGPDRPRGGQGGGPVPPRPVRHGQAWRAELWLGVNDRGPMTANGIYQMIARRGRQAGVPTWLHAGRVRAAWRSRLRLRRQAPESVRVHRSPPSGGQLPRRLAARGRPDGRVLAEQTSAMPIVGTPVSRAPISAAQTSPARVSSAPGLPTSEPATARHGPPDSRLRSKPDTDYGAWSSSCDSPRAFPPSLCSLIKVGWLVLTGCPKYCSVAAARAGRAKERARPAPAAPPAPRGPPGGPTRTPPPARCPSWRTPPRREFRPAGDTPHDRIMAGKRISHLRRVRLPLARRLLQVGRRNVTVALRQPRNRLP